MQRAYRRNREDNLNAPNSVKEIVQFLFNGKKRKDNEDHGIKIPAYNQSSSLNQEKPASEEPRRYRWLTDSFLRQIEKDKQERQELIEMKRRFARSIGLNEKNANEGKWKRNTGEH